MGKKLYVGNLSYQTGDRDLRSLFEAHGEVLSAQVIMDRESNRSKGFGFVEMATDESAAAAVEALNGYSVDGRALNVNEAKPRESGFGGDRRSYQSSDRRRDSGGGGRSSGYRSY